MANTLSRVSTPMLTLTVSLILFHAYIGFGYLLTANGRVPSLYTHVAMVAPITTWGLIFLLGIPFILLASARQDKAGAMASFMAAAPVGLFAALCLWAEFDGSAERIGSSALFILPLVMHRIMAVHSWRRDGRFS